MKPSAERISSTKSGSVKRAWASSRTRSRCATKPSQQAGRADVDEGAGRRGDAEVVQQVAHAVARARPGRDEARERDAGPVQRVDRPLEDAQRERARRRLLHLAAVRCAASGAGARDRRVEGEAVDLAALGIEPEHFARDAAERPRGRA
jgi:hypothetical protein